MEGDEITMENIQNISLDILDNQVYEYAYAKQYDEGRVLRFTVQENGNPYNLDGVIATFQAKKPDDTVVFDSVTINNDSNVIDFTLTLQTTILAGKIPYQIQLIKEDLVITTVTGYLKVDKSVVDLDDVESSDEFNALVDALKKAHDDYTYVMESAQKSAEAAKESATNAKASEDNANASADTASTKATEAANSQAEAANSASSASTSATTATNKAAEASNYATEAESFAHGNTETRENEDVDNAKYYYEQSKAISESLSGALRPMGTVTFANLPAMEIAAEGDMYNIIDEFTTTDSFKEGSGYTYPAGTNVYKTADGNWDCLAGTLVTGIKGNAESSYRKGNINITPSDIGFEIISTAEPSTQESGSYWLLDY